MYRQEIETFAGNQTRIPSETERNVWRERERERERQHEFGVMQLLQEETGLREHLRLLTNANGEMKI
jgi:hypothetical protein